MGKPVLKRSYDQQDFAEFYHRVQRETDLLLGLCRDHEMQDNSIECGFELELFLLNKNDKLASNNLNFIDDLHQDYLISEASQSTLEMNLPHNALQ